MYIIVSKAVQNFVFVRIVWAEFVEINKEIGLGWAGSSLEGVNISNVSPKYLQPFSD